MDYDKSTKRYENMLVLNAKTTNSYDYQDITEEIKRIDKRKWEEKLHCHRARPIEKEAPALTHWREPMVPFNLYLKPKDIVQTAPSDIQKPCCDIRDDLRETVQKTRPRVLLCPAVALDEMASQPRHILIRDMYTSSTYRDMNLTKDLSTLNVLRVRAPLPTHTSKTNPMALKQLSPPYVSPEWRMESVQWGSQQLQDSCDANRIFWLNSDNNIKPTTQL